MTNTELPAVTNVVSEFPAAVEATETLNVTLMSAQTMEWKLLSLD
jgi:hypothetical protein